MPRHNEPDVESFRFDLRSALIEETDLGEPDWLSPMYTNKALASMANNSGI